MPVAPDFRLKTEARITGADHVQASAFSRCLLALEQGHITMRDLDVLKELAYSQYLTREQIQVICMENVSKSVARRRLEVMLRLGLIATVRWEEPREENTPLQRVAYCVALNGAKLLRHYHGMNLPWRPGLAQRHLRRILAVLAANAFRLRVQEENPGLVEDWHIYHHPMGPVGRFSLGGQLVVLEVPRDGEDLAQIQRQRYMKWLEQAPLFFFLTPDEAMASVVLQRLSAEIPAERMLFSTDQRVIDHRPADAGFVWQWETGGTATPLSLA
jgi:hypothetical protein